MSEKKEVKETKFPFEIDFQRRIIGAFLTSVDFFKRCITIIKPEYFDNLIHQGIFIILNAYWEEYGNLPEDFAELDQVIGEYFVKDNRIPEEEVEKEMSEITAHLYSEDNFNYVSDKVVEFVRSQAVKHATIDGVDLWKEGKLEEHKRIMDEAHKVGLDGETQKAEFGTTFLKKKLPEREVFARGWAERGSCTLLAGKAGKGKSMLATNLMLYLAEGKLFLEEYEVLKPRTVLYINQDMPENLFQERLHRMTKGIDDPKVHERWSVKTYYTNPLKITVAEDRAKIHNLVESHFGVDLVIFDALRRFHHNEENPSKDATILMDYFFEVMEKFNVGILIIHHHGKGGKKDEREDIDLPKGSTVFVDRADMVVNMKPLPAKYNKDTVYLPSDFESYSVVNFAKQRGYKKQPDLAVELDDETLCYFQSNLWMSLGKRLTAEDVLEAVQDIGTKVAEKDLVDILCNQASRGVIFRAIKEAEEKQYIKRERLPTRGRPVVIRLVKPGEK